MAFRFFGRKADPHPPSREEPLKGIVSPVGARGCLVCGEALLDAPLDACAFCQGSGRVVERCRSGHAVCEACLLGPARNVILGTGSLTREKDPVIIASRLTLHPKLSLTEEDHHLAVSVALLAAFSNSRGEEEKRATRVAELAASLTSPKEPLLRRESGEGASEGAGDFVHFVGRILGRADDRDLEARAKERALSLIGKGDDALCSRRNTLVSILATARFARGELAIDLPARGLSCERAGKNPTCVGAGCPFNR